jgi:hypothetical protein
MHIKLTFVNFVHSNLDEVGVDGDTTLHQITSSMLSMC